MAVTDIRVSVAWKGHLKRKKVRLRLGASGELAVLDLWIQTAKNHPDGNLPGYTAEDLALDVDWTGDAAELETCLVDCGLIERLDGGGYTVHDWNDHQSWVIGAPDRSERARKAADGRWNKTKKSGKHAASMRQACGKHADGNAESETGNAPLPSSPLLSFPIPSTHQIACGGVTDAFLKKYPEWREIEASEYLTGVTPTMWQKWRRDYHDADPVWAIKQGENSCMTEPNKCTPAEHLRRKMNGSHMFARRDQDQNTVADPMHKAALLLAAKAEQEGRFKEATEAELPPVRIDGDD